MSGVRKFAVFVGRVMRRDERHSLPIAQQTMLRLRPSDVRRSISLLGKPSSVSIDVLKEAQETIDAWQSVLREFTAGDIAMEAYEPPEVRISNHKNVPVAAWFRV